MKKIIAIVLLVSVAFTSVFAADPAPAVPDYKITADSRNSIIAREPFYPMTPKVMGMGGAGIAKVGRTDSFFLNPAGLAKRDGVKFQMSLPYVDVTLYNIYNYLKPGKVQEDGTNAPSVLDTVMGLAQGGEVDYVKIAEAMLGVLTPGRNKIAQVDAGLSFVGGGFGMSFNARANVHDWGAKGGGLDSKLFAELEAAITIGYGHRIDLGSFSLDIGATARLNWMGYSDMIGATDALAAFPKQGAEAPAPGTPEEDPVMAIFGNLPLVAGWQFAGDVGLVFNMPFGFSIGGVVRNLGTDYYMTYFDNWKDFSKTYGESFSVDGPFRLKTPWSVDFGLGWKVNSFFATPTIEVDFIDAVGLFSDMDALKDGRTWLRHLKAGVDFRLLKFLDIRGGLNQGYWSLGAGVDLGLVKVDASYYWVEMGETLGDKNVDALQIRVNVGFDR